jgi:hypothetical protein
VFVFKHEPFRKFWFAVFNDKEWLFFHRWKNAYGGGG